MIDKITAAMFPADVPQIITLLFMVVFTLLMVWMSIDDWKDNTVSGWACLLTWVLTIAAVHLVTQSLVVFCLVIVALFLFYGPMHLDKFGDADIQPWAIWLAVFVKNGADPLQYVLFPLSLLICLVPYAKFYAKRHGEQWYWGCQMMLPMLPCFTVAWVCSVVAYCILKFIFGIV